MLRKPKNALVKNSALSQGSNTILNLDGIYSFLLHWCVSPVKLEGAFEEKKQVFCCVQQHWKLQTEYVVIIFPAIRWARFLNVHTN